MAGKRGGRDVFPEGGRWKVTQPGRTEPVSGNLLNKGDLKARGFAKRWSRGLGARVNGWWLAISR